jgi:hypothetical protein
MESGQLAGRRPRALGARPDVVCGRLFRDTRWDSGITPTRAADSAGAIAPQEASEPGRETARERCRSHDLADGAVGKRHRPHGACQPVGRNSIEPNPVHTRELVASDSQQNMDPRRRQRRAHECAPPGYAGVVVVVDET